MAAEPKAAMRRSRQIASEHKRSLVLTATNAQLEAGRHPSIAGIARQAGVGRKFIYDHPDLRADIELEMAKAASRIASDVSATARVSAASLRAELENAREQNRRLSTQLRALEHRLSRAEGAGLVADELLPAHLVGEFADRKLADEVAQLKGQLFDTKEELRQNAEELDAARAINRELMQRVNHLSPGAG